ncbi:MAG TPA: protein phosphatase 2C domain-containing protein, partial [Acidimicrobiales bacterium]|nr:protein phosphatase 2C domain-containing protein [Acidimicrobiales bacterium]
WAHGDGILLMAVADGVGSVAGSSGAAERACRAAVEGGLGEAEAAAGRDPDTVVRAALAAGNQAAAEGNGATTLVVAALLADGTGSTGRIGDSTAFLLGEDGAVAEAFEPPDPDRTDTSTAALPGEVDEAEVTSFELPGDGILVLATDGIADPWRDGPSTVAPALAGALMERPGPAQLLAVADFSRQGCHDDRTIVCAWLTAGG